MCHMDSVSAGGGSVASNRVQAHSRSAKRPLYATIAALLLGSAPAAAFDWQVYSVQQNPSGDRLYRHALGNLPATYQDTGIRFDTSDVSGLSLTTPDTGWYLSLNDTSFSGLYRLEGGISMHVARQRTQLLGIGDMTFSHDRSHLLCTIAAGGVGGFPARLYRVDFDGEFTLLGNVTGPGIAQTSVFGLATDPVSGDLYGCDSRSDSLIRINSATGTATVVGTFGFNIQGEGGLAFSPDGSTLVMRASGKFFLVDKGNAATQAVATLAHESYAIQVLPEPSMWVLVMFALLAYSRVRDKGDRETQ